MPKSKKPLSFEKALEKLEKTVEQLEDGQLGLEESLQLFEEGVKLARQCNRQLEDAQSKIEKLTRDGDGEWIGIALDTRVARATQP